MKRLAAMLAILAVILGACATDSGAEACGESSITLEMELTADGLTPDDPAVCREQQVTLVVESTVDGTLHIHGYDEVPAIAVGANHELRLEFVADRSGQFPIELHTDDNLQGASVGILTVHEP